MMVPNCGRSGGPRLILNTASEELLKIRIASSIALAVAIAFGATGCGLIAPQGSTDPYSPSDGRDVNIEVQVPRDVLEANSEVVRDDEADSDVRNVDVRNIILVPDATGDNLNVVFTAVNSTTVDQQLSITFAADGATASALFDVPVGTTRFGDPEGEEGTVKLLQLPAKAGSMVSATYELSNQFNLGIEIFCAVSDPDLVAGTAVEEGEADGGCYVPVLDTASDSGSGLKEYEKYVLPEDFSKEDPQIFLEDAEASESTVGNVDENDPAEEAADEEAAN